MADRRIESIAAMLVPLGHLVETRAISDMTVRFADGRLRDVEVDGKFYTMMDGKWFRLDKLRGK